MRPSHSYARTPGLARPLYPPVPVNVGVHPSPPPAPSSVSRHSSSSSAASPVVSGGVLRSFDQDFGDGSDLMDVDEAVIVSAANIKTTYHVKLEPMMSPPAAAPRPPAAVPPPAHPSLDQPTAAHQQQRSSSFSMPPPPPHAAAAHATPSFPVPAAPSADSLRIAELEAQLLEKSGEVRLLRSRQEAMDRKRAADAAALAARQANSSGGFPSSQISSSQRDSRRAEAEAAARVQAQIESLKAQKESTEMQSQEYAKENSQLKRKMESMEKMQQQLMQQLRAKQSSGAAGGGGTAHGASNFALSQSTARTTADNKRETRPTMNVTHHATTSGAPSHAAPPVSPPPVAAQPIVRGADIWPHPTHNRIHESDRWQPPAFLAQMFVRRSKEYAVSTPPRTSHIDLQLLTRLLAEMQQAAAPLTVRTRPAGSQPDPSSADDSVSALFDRLSGHLTSGLQLVLTQRSSLVCALAPLRQLLLLCTVTASQTVHSLMPSSPPATVPSEITPRVASPPKAPPPDPWERSVRVKLEYGANAAAAAAAATHTAHDAADEKRSFPLPSESLVPPPTVDVKRITSNLSRDAKHARVLFVPLMQILHFCCDNDAECAQEVYQDLSRASHTASSSVHAPGAAAAASTASDDAFPRLGESLSWQAVLLRVFDDGFSRLYAERVERAASTVSSTNMPATVAASAASLTLLDLTTSVLQLVCRVGVPRGDTDDTSIDNTTISVDDMIAAWMPRVARLMARIHANAALRHPVSTPNSPRLTGRIHASVARLVSRWCRHSPTPILIAIQSASHVVVPGHVKSSTSLESSSPCTCNLLQLLLLHARRSDAATTNPADSSCAFDDELVIDLLAAARRCYAARQPAEGAPPFVCTTHAREWGERDVDLPLVESISLLFALPYSLFRLLLLTAHELAARLQRRTQQRVRALLAGTEGMIDLYNNGTSAVTPRDTTGDTLAHVIAALRLVQACLRVDHRRWRDVHTDPLWVGLLQGRTCDEADRRIDLLLMRIQEACVAVRQSHQQLRATDERAQESHAHRWSEAVRIATELTAWFDPTA